MCLCLCCVCVECIVELVMTVFSTPIDFRLLVAINSFFFVFAVVVGGGGGGVLDEILYLHKQNRHLSRFGNLATTTANHKNIHNFFFLLSMKMIWTASCQHTHSNCERRRKLHFYLCQTNRVRSVCELLFNDTTRHMHTWSKLLGIISQDFEHRYRNVNSHWQQQWY